MKIGLYLQDKDHRNHYHMDLQRAAEAKLDLFVFPEDCYTPFSAEFENLDALDPAVVEQAVESCSEIGEQLGCPVIFSGVDVYGTIYSIYVNHQAVLNDIDSPYYQYYYKHTAGYTSAFEFEGYSSLATEDLFYPIKFKEHNIGMTICYDCNHSAFSRMWGLNGADLLINSTGGNVQYHKWYRYNKVRALENGCFNFCTMGYTAGRRNSSYTFGFTPEGRLMEGVRLGMNKSGSPAGVYVYDTEMKPSRGEPDISLQQPETSNKYQHFFIEPSRIENLLSISRPLSGNIYLKPHSGKNLIFCTIDGKDITKPENVLQSIYHPALRAIPNKRYILINRWKALEEEYYAHILSDILRVRSMENYLAVLLLSPSVNKCYQCTDNRMSQLIRAEKDGSYGIDLNRTSGPEAIWKNKPGMMKASWREGYESLISLICNKSH